MSLHPTYQEALLSEDRVALCLETAGTHESQVSGRIAGEVVCIKFKGKGNRDRAGRFLETVNSHQDDNPVDLIAAISQVEIDTGAREIHFSLALAILKWIPEPSDRTA